MPRTSDEKRKSSRFRIPHDLADCRSVEVFMSAADGIGQQLLGHCTNEELGTIEQSLLESRDSREPTAVGKATGSIHGPAAFEVSPTSHRIKVLEGKSDRINQLVTAGTCGIGTMLSQSLSNREFCRDRVVLATRARLAAAAGVVCRECFPGSTCRE